MDKNISDIMPPMAQRPRLAIDCGSELVYELRKIALDKHLTLRELVLKALAAEYPEITGKVTKELGL